MTNFYDSLGINGGLNISANSTTDAIYVSQLGTGNAMLIEDSANPDLTPFIINSGGSVNIGRIEYLETSSGTKAKLQVNNSTSQIPFSGLPFTTNFIVQGFNNNNIGFFTTDVNTSQLYFGTPSSVYGAKLSWYYTGGTFDLSTQTTGGTLTFGTDQGIERMRILSNGNIGIGTTAATETLTVNGSIGATTISGGTFYGDGYNITNINEQEFYLWDLVVQGNKLLNGGVSYVSGLTFDVSVLSYIIDGTIYDVSSFTTITLNSGDTSFDRIDVIYVDTNGLVGVLEGTPSANPVKPNLDGDTQVEISFVLIPVNGTTVGGVSEFKIYEEDLGPPSEWLFSSFGSQSLKISGDSTEDAYSGTTSIKVDSLTGSSLTTYGSGFILSGTTGPVDINNYATIQFAIKNFSANTNTNRIRFKLLNQNGSANGNLVYMNAISSPSSYIKYISSNVSNWQLISIPLWRFGVTNTNVYGLEVAFALSSATPARYRFDTLKFVEGVASSPPSNSWTTIKGDSTQTITATSPNATLTISGGTNLNSTIISPSTVKLNLDSDINLNGITAVTLSTGFNTTNSGVYSVSNGFNTTSYGSSSHSEGFGTLAEGFASHAEGENTIAFGTGSHTEGLGTYTSGDHQTAVGKFNATGNTTQGAFIVGNGIGNNNRTNLIFAAESAVTINYDLTVSGTTNLNETLINQDRITILNSFVPTGSTDPSYTTGTITWDDNFLYWKTSTQWLRISGDTW